MRRADFKVVIDSCVLANIAVCDLLLRLAEEPRLYLPQWSSLILSETHRTHVKKLSWKKEYADSFLDALNGAFPEACVSEFEHLVEHCSNHTKDRHVLTCAIHCKAELILTFNLKDFDEAALSPWRIEAKHPQDYLLSLYSIAPEIVVRRLTEISQKRRMEFDEYIINIGRFLPAFCQKVLSDSS